MKRIKLQLLFGEDLSKLDDSLESGIVFFLRENGIIDARFAKNGLVVGPYEPAYFELVDSKDRIDISDQLDASEQSIDFILEYSGTPFTGIGFAFSEDGFCYREVGYRDGQWVFDAQWNYAGMSSFDSHNDFGYSNRAWHADGVIKEISVGSKNIGSAAISLTQDGKIISLQMSGGIRENFSKILQENSLDLFSIDRGNALIKCATSVFLSGDLIDEGIFSLLEQNSALMETKQISLRSISPDLTSFHIFLTLPGLEKLHVISALDCHLSAAKAFKKMRANVDVSFDRLVPGKTRIAEVVE